MRRPYDPVLTGWVVFTYLTLLFWFCASQHFANLLGEVQGSTFISYMIVNLIISVLAGVAVHLRIKKVESRPAE